MSYNFQAAYSIIRSSVVGLGFRNDPEYQIIGSGFIVHQSGWIMTNQHVLSEFLVEFEGKTVLRPDASAFFFVSVPPEDGFVGVGGMLVASIIESVIPPPKDNKKITTSNKTFRGLKPRQILPAEPLDIGVCKIDINRLPKELLPLKTPQIIHSVDVKEGIPVGILGFPQGLSYPVRFKEQDTIQMTPLLQTGIISGILPFSSLKEPSSFVLDILTAVQNKSKSYFALLNYQ